LIFQSRLFNEKKPPKVEGASAILALGNWEPYRPDAHADGSSHNIVGFLFARKPWRFVRFHSSRG
jgi:hypothetical protein